MLTNIIIDVVLFIVFIGCSLLLLVKKYLKSEYEYIFYVKEKEKSFSCANMEKMLNLFNIIFLPTMQTEN